jgi:HSP20 family protein
MIQPSRKNKPEKKQDPDIGNDSPYVTGIVNWRLTIHPHTWHPATDVYETENAIIIRIELAGMDRSDFNIIMNQNSLTITGSRQDTARKKAFHQMEIPFGEFKSEIRINKPIDPEKVEAEYNNGLLYITLHIVEPRHINIQDSK